MFQNVPECPRMLQNVFFLFFWGLLFNLGACWDKRLDLDQSLTIRFVWVHYFLLITSIRKSVCRTLLQSRDCCRVSITITCVCCSRYAVPNTRSLIDQDPWFPRSSLHYSAVEVHWNISADKVGFFYFLFPIVFKELVLFKSMLPCYLSLEAPGSTHEPFSSLIWHYLYYLITPTNYTLYIVTINNHPNIGSHQAQASLTVSDSLFCCHVDVGFVHLYVWFKKVFI